MTGDHRVLHYAVMASLAFHAILLFGISLREPAKRVVVEYGPLLARLMDAPAVKPAPLPESEPIKPAAKPQAAAKPKPKPRAVEKPQAHEPSAPAAPSLPARSERVDEEPTQAPAMPAEAAPPEAAAPEAVGSEEGRPASSPPPLVIARGEAPDPRMLRLQYGIALKSEMARQVKYPTIARREGWQGKGEVHLEIGDSGWIAELRVVRSTGNPVLDQAVVDGVRRAAPRVPIPPGLRGQRFDVAIPFEMNLRDP